MKKGPHCLSAREKIEEGARLKRDRPKNTRAYKGVAALQHVRAAKKTKHGGHYYY